MKPITWLLSLTLAFSSSIFAQPLKVGISLVDLSNPFFAILAEEISHQLKAEQAVEILLHSSAYNLNKQVHQLDDFIQQNVDIIFVAASESEAIAPIVKRAKAEGIIVVAVDIESSGADIVITSDNIQAGNIACHHLIAQVGKNSKVAIINGQPISSVINRVIGCKQAISAYPDVELVSSTHNSSGTFSGGLESMTYLLIEHPDLDGVFTINDLAGLGALEATTHQHADQVKIVSVDASPDFQSQLKTNNTSNFIASTAQFPRVIAQRAVSLAVERWKQNTSQSETNSPPITELIQTRLVTRDNLNNFANWELRH
jgi:ribose transport system substrate-binding protein